MKRQYELLINEYNKDYHGQDVREIGKVIDITTGKVAIYIYYEKDLFRKQGLHTCIYEYEREDGDYPVEMVDDLHRPTLYEYPDIFLAITLHELGHYVNGDLNEESDDAEAQSNERPRVRTEERLKAILAGKVDEHELKADAFAVSKIGKNTFIRSLDHMINMRKKRGDKDMELAIRELELRKKAVKNMK